MAFHDAADELGVGEEYRVGDLQLEELAHANHQAEGQIEHQQGNGNAR